MIFVIARMLNEKTNIECWLKNYSHLADKFLISDGGSTDGSLEIALNSANVEIIHFSERTYYTGTTAFMNNEPVHFNYLVKEAKSRCKENDWVIYDDIDSFPNYLMAKYGRMLIEQSHFPEVYIRRYYMWGIDHYFPKLLSDNPPDNSMHSFWAWQPHKIHIYAGEELGPFHMDYRGFGNANEKTYIHPPLCLTHYTWPSENVVAKKAARYAQWGRPQDHPTSPNVGGTPELKLEFLTELYPYKDYFKDE